MLEAFLISFLWLVIALIMGLVLGSFTGLIPGFHVNNVALILLALAPLLLSVGIPLSAVAAIIIATGTVHTFLNYIPSALIGTPDADTALSLLPGHRMLLSGNAPKGVAYSARGSQLGLLLSIPMIILIRIAFGPEMGLYEILKSQVPVLILIISLILILSDSTRLRWPTWLCKLLARDQNSKSRLAGIIAITAFFLLCGGYGVVIFSLPAKSPLDIADSSMLMPSLAGLFGIANLLDIIATKSVLPPQRQDWRLPPSKPLIKPCLLSSLAGAIMGVLPGMTASQATVFVMGAKSFLDKQEEGEYVLVSSGKKWSELSDKELMMMALVETQGDDENKMIEQDLQVIAILSAVNTAVTVMVLGFLYIIGRSRSGATIALQMMYPIETWSAYEPSADLVRLIGITLAAGLMSIPLMRHIGKAVLQIHSSIPLEKLVLGVILFVILLVFLTTGVIGLLVLLVGTIIGLLPPRMGIRRSHGMGIILLPVMLYTFDLQ